MGLVDDHGADGERLAALEAELVEMRRQVAELRAQVRSDSSAEPASTTARVSAEREDANPRSVSRRGLIAGAAGAVAASAAAVVATATPAAANSQGQSWTLGEFDNNATSTTGLRASNIDPVLLVTNNGTSKGNAAQFYVHETANTGAVTHHESAGLGPAAEFITSNPSNSSPTVNSSTGGTGSAGQFVVSNTANTANALGVQTSGTGTAISGRALGGGTAGFLSANGTNAALYVTMSGTGYGIFVNHANTTSANPSVFIQTTSPSAALRAKGPITNINLWPRTGVPTSDTVPHGAGDLVEDSNGVFWVCVGGGTPGQWRKVAGPTTAGALHILPAPARVYDSRSGTAPSVGPKTPLDPNVARIIDLKANSSTVPAGATGALVTVLLVNASSGNGNFTLWAAGVAKPQANTLVWGGSTGRFTAKELTALDSQARIQVSSSLKTDIVIDVVGYYR